MRVQASELRVGLRSEQKDGRAIEKSVRNAGVGVRRAGTKRGERDSDPACEPRVRICHEHRAGFVAHKHKVHAAFAQGIQHLHIFTAGQTEDHIHFCFG